MAAVRPRLTDLGLLVGRLVAVGRLGRVEQARPARGLLPLHPPPDRDDPALLRSLPVPVEIDPAGPYENTWHITGGYDPAGHRLAVAGLYLFAVHVHDRDAL